MLDFGSLLDVPVSPDDLGLFASQIGGPQLTPSAQPGPGPQAAPLPQPDPNAPAPGQPPAASGILAKLGQFDNWLKNSIVGHPEVGYDKILTPEEIESTKPSLLGAIFHGEGSANQIEQAKLDHLVQIHQLGATIARQNAILSSRAAYYAANPMQDNMTEQQSSDYLRKAYMAAAARGDVEEMQKFNPVIDKLFPKSAATHVGAPYVNTNTGETQYFSEEPGSNIGPEWKPIPKSAGGTPQIFHLGKPGPNGETFDYRGPGEIQQGDEPVSVENSQFNQGNINDRFATTQLATAAGKLGTSMAPLVKQATFFNDWKAALADARKGNTAATKTMVTQLAQQADPGVQLRLGTLNFIKTLDPSYAGRFAAFIQAAKSGTIPADQLDNAEKLVDDLHEAGRRYYSSQYSNFVQSFPQFGEQVINRYLRNPDDVFGGTSGGKYSANNPFAPK